MKTGIVVQARLNSTRFPRKALALLGGITVLSRVLDRCRETNLLTILASPDKELSPDVLGPEDDVLARYLIAANAYSLDVIMRITADCPLIRPDLCRKVLDLYHTGCSYAAIDWPRGGFPKGYGCEVFSKFTLQLANELAVDQYDREHVTPWMQRNVRCKYLENDKDESHLNYCVDTPDDLKRLEEIFCQNK